MAGALQEAGLAAGAKIVADRVTIARTQLDDGVLGANAAASRAAFAAVVGLLDQNRLDAVDTIDTEQAEVDALHAVGAAAEVDDRVPSSRRLFVDLIDLAA